MRHERIVRKAEPQTFQPCTLNYWVYNGADGVRKLSPSRHKHKLRKQLRVLLVFKHGAVKGRQHFALVFFAQHRGVDILSQQQFDPINQLARGWLFLEAGHFA